MIWKAQNKKQPLTTCLNGTDMRALLLLTLLTGCANLKDNTTTVDKVIIGTTLGAIIIGGINIGS